MTVKRKKKSKLAAIDFVSSSSNSTSLDNGSQGLKAELIAEDSLSISSSLEGGDDDCCVGGLLLSFVTERGYKITRRHAIMCV